MKKILEVLIAGNDRSSGAFASAGKGADGLTKRFGGMGSALKAAALPAIAFGALSVKAFGESEVAAQQMTTAIQNNKQMAGDTVSVYQDLAASIQDKTAADDESVLSGAAALANFGLTRKEIASTLPLVVDYARRMGKDIPSAAQDVGKALLGNAKALKPLGIEFKATGDKAKDFATIQDLLRSKVGGFAEGEAKTSVGRLQQMKNEFNDMQEVVGGKLVAAFDFLSRNMATVGPVIAGVVTGMIAFKATMIASTLVTATFGTTAGAAWAAAAGPIGILVAAAVAIHYAISKLTGPIALFVSAIAGLPFVVFRFRDEIFGAFKAIASFLADIWSKISSRLIAAWNAIRTAASTIFNAVKAVLVGIWNGIKAAAELVFNALRVFFETNFNIIKTIFTTIWNAIRTVVTGVWDGIKAVIGGAIGFVRDTIQAVLNVISSVWRKAWGAVKGVFGEVWEGIKAIARAAIDWIVAKIKWLWDKLTAIAKKIKSIFTGGGGGKAGNDDGSQPTDVPLPPGAAHGAFVPATPGGMLMRVGEGFHDEWILPEPVLRAAMSNGGGSSDSGGRSVQISEGAFQVTVNGGDPAEVEQAVTRAMRDLVRLLRAG